MIDWGGYMILCMYKYFSTPSWLHALKIIAICTVICVNTAPTIVFSANNDAIRSVDWPVTKFKTLDCIITTDAKRDWFGEIAVITGFHLDKTHGFAYRVLINENVNNQSRWYRYEELEKIAVKVQNCELLD